MQLTRERQHDLPEFADISRPVLERVDRPALRSVLDELIAPTRQAGDREADFDNAV